VRVLFNAQTTCMALCALIGYLFVARRTHGVDDVTEPVGSPVA
jgi:hypothetical protein